ncbi:DNA damage-binding protein 2 [Homalodisca vitripennis]|nr:DNA damage-binding protein 2 [Homalodisca vitripennis]
MSYTFPSIPARPMTSLVKWEEVLYCILPLCRVCSVYVSTSPLSNTILFVPASWHPLADLFLVGSFPDIPIEDKLLSKELRGVDVYSAKTGRLCHQLTESRLLISLCEFNCAGQVLATSASRLGYVSLWHQRHKLEH